MISRINGARSLLSNKNPSGAAIQLIDFLHDFLDLEISVIFVVLQYRPDHSPDIITCWI
jgi:hypothetical protein